MMTGWSRGRGMRASLTGAGLLLAIVVHPLLSQESLARSDGGRSSPALRFRYGTAEARLIEPLLTRLLASGFFRGSEAVRAEILNNEYGFFGPESPTPPRGSKGWGCFSRRPAGQDAILVSKDIFAHFLVGLEETTVQVDVGDRVLPVLVHEICHDLWVNVLDDGERAAFSREGEAFMRDFHRAQAAEEIRLFLTAAGEDPANPRCLRSYADIGDILAANPTRAMCGFEIFAWLGERLFTAKGQIPLPLRKYYSSILEKEPHGIGVPGKRSRRR